MPLQIVSKLFLPVLKLCLQKIFRPHQKYHGVVLLYFVTSLQCSFSDVILIAKSLLKFIENFIMLLMGNLSQSHTAV